MHFDSEVDALARATMNLNDQSEDPVRDDMVASAAEVFANGGFGQTPTKALETDEFSESRFFHKFGDKNGILRAIFDFFWAKMYWIAKGAGNGSTGALGFLSACMHGYIKLFRSYPHICRVVTMNTYPKANDRHRRINYSEQLQTLVLRSLALARTDGTLAGATIPIPLIYHALRGAIEKVLSEYYHEKYIDKRKRTSFSIEDVELYATSVLEAFLRPSDSAVVNEVNSALNGYRTLLAQVQVQAESLQKCQERFERAVVQKQVQVDNLMQ